MPHKFLSTLCITILVSLLSSCACKEGAPPSFWCKVQERVIECSKEVAISAGGGLAQEVIKALRSGPDWESALGKLILAGSDEVLCILGNLPEIFSAKPSAGIEELSQRPKDLANAKAFLAKRKVTVKVVK